MAVKHSLLTVLCLLPSILAGQRPLTANERATLSAEGERKVMEQTLEEVLKLVGEDEERAKLFREAQNTWVDYVKKQAEADADGVSGEAKYPQAYFETMRELTRYRTRVLEGCLSRLKAEEAGVRMDGGTPGNAGGGGRQAARDWRQEVGDEAVAEESELFEAEFEGVEGVLAGQWRGDSLWRGVFLADRGDVMVLYGGRMESGGIVFEAWQEGARIGRGYVRDEEGSSRGRFFDERRRESPIVLRRMKRPSPVGHEVALTEYAGLLGSDEVTVGLEWHHTRFVRGEFNGTTELRGHNYSQGKVFLEEWEPGEGGKLIGFWRVSKLGSGNVRWVGVRQTMAGDVREVEFSR